MIFSLLLCVSPFKTSWSKLVPHSHLPPMTKT